MHWQSCVSGRDCPCAMKDDIIKEWEDNKKEGVRIFLDPPWCFEQKIGGGESR